LSTVPGNIQSGVAQIENILRHPARSFSLQVWIRDLNPMGVFPNENAAARHYRDTQQQGK
jgi:hypothetical protein